MTNNILLPHKCVKKLWEKGKLLNSFYAVLVIQPKGNYTNLYTLNTSTLGARIC